MLPAKAERRAARNQNREPPARLQELTDEESCAENLLEVVEHEQHLLSPQYILQLLCCRSASGLYQAENLKD